jgi:hypothetical protein
VKEIAAERVKLVRKAIVLFRFERQFVDNAVVQPEDGFGLGARVLVFAFGKELRDGEKAVGDALHRGDNHDDLRCLRNGPDQAGGMQHALGT